MPSDSTIFMYRSLMLNSIKQHVPEADTIPTKNKVLNNMLSVYITRIVTGSKIESTLSIEKLLEFIESGVSKLDKSDTKNVLTKNIDDLRKLLSDRKDLRDVLNTEFAQIVSDTNKSFQDIAGLVAPQPEAHEGNVAIEKTLATKMKIINTFSSKVIRAADQIAALFDSTKDLASTYGKISGVVIKPSALAIDAPSQFIAPAPE